MKALTSGMQWLNDGSAIAWVALAGALAGAAYAGAMWNHRRSLRVQHTLQELKARSDRLERENQTLREEAQKRQQAERQLQASQLFLQLVMDNIPQAVFWKDRQSVYLGCNRVQAQLAGLDHPEDIAGKTDFDLPWTVAQAEWYRLCDRLVIERDTPQSRIIEMQTQANGCQRWCETNKIPLHDHTGRVIGILGTFEDITERKESELALKKAEEKYRTIFNEAIESIFQSTPKGRYISANPALARIYGYRSPEELIASVRNIETELYADPQLRADFIRRIEKTGHVTDFEARVFRGEDIIWISESAREVRDCDGRLLYYEGTVIDITERKQVEIDLERTLSLLQATLEATADGIIVVDPDEKIVLWNQRYAELFQVPPHLLQEGGSDRALITHLRQFMRSPSQFEEAATSSYQQPTTVHVTMLELVDGTVVERHSHPQTIGDQIVGAVISYRDVTHLKQVQIALERQVNHTRLVGHITREIRQSLDRDRIFQTAAAQLGRALGVSRCLLHAYKINPTPSLPIVAEYRESYCASAFNTVDAIPVRRNPHALAVLASDRAIAVADVLASTLLEPIRAVCISLQLRSMLCARTSHQGQPNGVIALQQCDRRRQWTPDELELLEAVASQMGIAIEQARLLERERHLLDEQVAKNQALARAKQEADSANQAKGQFLAMMSHEIRTPLNAVLGTAELLQSTRLNGRQSQGLRTICSSGNALLTMIDDILDYSKIESDPFELDCQPFSLRECIENTLDVLHPLASEKGLHLTVKIAKQVPDIVFGDAPRLQQILTNLLGNAIKFTDKGRVLLSLTASQPIKYAPNPREEKSIPQQARSFRFAVRDTGIGIPNDRLTAVFAAFQQVDGSMSRRYGGTGLGLAISRRLCELMGGNIGVCSKMGQGSVFYFELPFPVGDVSSLPTPSLLPFALQDLPSPHQGSSPTRALPLTEVSPGNTFATHDHPGLQPPFPLETPLSSKASRILVVEDVPTNRTIASQMLFCLGYSADFAENGRDALQKLRHQSYDLVLMDLQMPEMDGMEATQSIRQLGHTIQQPRIVAMTAHAGSQHRTFCLQAGMDDYTVKPLRLKTLATLLREHLPAEEAPYPASDREVTERPVIPVPATLSNCLDLQVLADLRDIASDNYLELVREVADHTLRDVPIRLCSLRSAIAEGQLPEVSRAAHALRSLSASIGAVPLARVCSELEHTPQSGDSLLEAIEREWDRVRPWLQSDLSDWLP